MKRGRKTKLTPEVQKIITDEISVHGLDNAASYMAGIDPSTFYGWLNRGQQAKSGIYFDFLKAVKKARERFKRARVMRIAKAGETTWQADAWLLERKFPDEFSLKIKTENENNTTVKFNITGNCSPDEI